MADSIKPFEEIERARLIKRLEYCLDLLRGNKPEGVYPVFIERCLSDIISHGVALYGVTVLERFVQPVIENQRTLTGYCANCGKDPCHSGSNWCQSCDASVELGMTGFDKPNEMDS